MSGIVKNVTIYRWPYCQICLECANGLDGIDNESGIITGIAYQPFAICSCCEYDNDGSKCPSINRKEK